MPRLDRNDAIQIARYHERRRNNWGWRMFRKALAFVPRSLRLWAAKLFIRYAIWALTRRGYGADDLRLMVETYFARNMKKRP